MFLLFTQDETFWGNPCRAWMAGESYEDWAYMWQWSSTTKHQGSKKTTKYVF